jgi:tRNA(adenine34) deaminase
MFDLKDEIKNMSLAILESKKAIDLGNFPCGAIILHNGKVIGKGNACDKNHGDVTCHAEILAIKEACNLLGNNDLSQCVIYTTVEPCLMCASAIFQAGISNIVIGVSRGNLKKFLRPRSIRIYNLIEDLNYPVQIKVGVLKNDILTLLKNTKK